MVILQENALKIRILEIEKMVIKLQGTTIRVDFIEIEIIMGIGIDMIGEEIEMNILIEGEDNIKEGHIEMIQGQDHFLVHVANKISAETIVLVLVLLKTMVARGMLIGIMTSGEVIIMIEKDKETVIEILLVDAEIVHIHVRVLDLNLLDDDLEIEYYLWCLVYGIGWFGDFGFPLISVWFLKVFYMEFDGIWFCCLFYLF